MKLQKKSKILSVYFTAGYPSLNSTIPILKALERNGVDMVEVGMPYSDPMADGPVIQQSSAKAIANGMTIDKLFGQLHEARSVFSRPIMLMGYLNPILQYGLERFAQRASKVGVSGLIVPDMPLDYYRKSFKSICEKHKLGMVFLVTPNTTDDRVREIDELSSPFIYAVSTYAITGSQGLFSQKQSDYLTRLKNLNLQNPVIVGFGIHNRQTIDFAHTYAQGAIIGTAFINSLKGEKTLDSDIDLFFRNLGIKQ
ncbi:tryptophan synthase subunit alpha [Perlabentimonas gracilis]|uniref:tryptophan synthase subunit alpha n=1 Tax=Perlabentimonas gracilis TaxID=2715279 RepID=UPI001409D825|nr:tryptophan synthase subunit alpha [Perlabentimonas gracilis]NHB68848.1 tryptophan synthase subunit alpha [Perlabentimonas gracilis]